MSNKTKGLCMEKVYMKPIKCHSCIYANIQEFMGVINAILTCEKVRQFFPDYGEPGCDYKKKIRKSK
jgi:hypothetical protein